jgi:hypothetical protein
MKILIKLRLWWHQDILNSLTDIAARQEAIRVQQKNAMAEMWLKLAQWWQQEYINIKPPVDWPTVGEVGTITCPICQASYKVDDKIPHSSKRATVVCSNAECGESMEITPDSYYGWLKPKVEYRERSYK